MQNFVRNRILKNMSPLDTFGGALKNLVFTVILSSTGGRIAECVGEYFLFILL